MITTTIEHLSDTGYIFFNYQSNKKYIILDISNCENNDEFIYQKGITISNNDTQTWQNAIYPNIKQKLEYSNSYCEMLLNNFQNLEDQVNKLKSEMQHKQSDQSGLNGEKDRSKDENGVEIQYKNHKIESVDPEQIYQQTKQQNKQQKLAQKSVQKQEGAKDHEQIKTKIQSEKNWSNLFPVFEPRNHQTKKEPQNKINKNQDNIEKQLNNQQNKNQGQPTKYKQNNGGKLSIEAAENQTGQNIDDQIKLNKQKQREEIRKQEPHEKYQEVQTNKNTIKEKVSIEKYIKSEHEDSEQEKSNDNLEQKIQEKTKEQLEGKLQEKSSDKQKEKDKQNEKSSDKSQEKKDENKLEENKKNLEQQNDKIPQAPTNNQNIQNPGQIVKGEEISYQSPENKKMKNMVTPKSKSSNSKILFVRR